ncbi:MAG: histidine phosphatase family protein [Alphaproteobacteria bacterium]|nr:histidine phosphatase family protein [Alphaproteobacteria bacterium]MDD9920109.1 histidine phosphatase family protein [Alphaproteobacteria bacterium]
MRLLLARHGNTFAAGDKVVMAGVSNDLPLVPCGEEQAEEIAQALAAAKIFPEAVYCSELQRAFRGCEIIIEELGLDTFAITDKRINEIDYGAWTGLSDEEINQKFGEESRLAWQQQSIWPTNAEWGASSEEIAKNVEDFATDIANQYSDNATVLVTSHGGVLRYFLKLVEGEWDARHAAQTLKVKTGHLSSLLYKNGQWQLEFWNVNPAYVEDEFYG